MRRLVRAPLLHFLALGLVLLAVRAGMAPDPAPIRIGHAEIAELRATWRAQEGAEPDRATLDGLVRSRVDERLLAREGLRLGLHRGDPVVRQRVVRNMRFLEPDADADDDALYRRAVALGMLERDPVVQRRLAQRVRHRVAAGVAVSEAEVRAALARSGEQQRAVVSRYDLRHVLFSADRRRDPAGDAAAVLARIADADMPADAGDPFPLGERFHAATRDTIAGRMGSAFAAAVAAAPEGRWIGPATTPFGAHLIRVEAVSRRAPAADRSRVVAALYDAADERALHRLLERLRERYPVEVAGRVPALAEWAE